jgi:excinuclease ABC subunit B
MGEFDVLVGINLLREGLDIPEVSLVAILDADKQGFLRNETSLVQTIGRAARNADGRVIMYADSVSPQMKAAIDVTEYRRHIQDAYNKEHDITPKTVKKSVRPKLEATASVDNDDFLLTDIKPAEMTKKQLKEYVEKLETEMKAAAAALQFEQAAKLRDVIFDLKVKLQ